MTITYPGGELTPNQERRLDEGYEPQITYVSPDGYATWHLMGPRSPIPGVQEGVTVTTDSIKNLMPTWQMLDLVGANQDGATFQDAVYQPSEIDMMVEAHGLTPLSTRKVIRDWINSWDVKQFGKLSVEADDNGVWSADVRWLKTPTEALMRASSYRQRFLWTCRIDDAFWYAPDSVSTRTNTGVLSFTNTGDQPAWPRYLLYGPGTFSIGNGANSSDLVEFGPLLAGQVVLMETEPRRRSIVDITPTQIPAQNLTPFQTFIQALITFATNNNVPPLLRQFESLFGIQPPQGTLYSLMDGRFTTPIPAQPMSGAVTSSVSVQISGGSSATKIIGAITPRRRWPL